MARQVGDQVGEMASSAQERAGEMASTVMDRTAQAPGQVQRMVEDSPFMAAALAASVGAAVGLVLPTTQTENQMMGSTRDRVMGRAQQFTDDTIEKVSSVAQEVQTTASKEARTQGLTV